MFIDSKVDNFKYACGLVQGIIDCKGTETRQICSRMFEIIKLLSQPLCGRESIIYFPTIYAS